MENQTQQKSNKTMNIVLWILQALFGIMFLMGGAMSTFTPIEKLAATQEWVNHVPQALVRFIGLAQIFGAIGLVLPSMLRIKPQLTVWAARGFIALFLSAVIFHIMIGQFKMIGIPIVFGLIATFIVWGRGKKAIIQPR